MRKLLLLAFMVTFAWAVGAKAVGEKPALRLTGDEEINAEYVPSGPGLSPGDSVGWTKYDYQRNGQTAWQAWYDAADGTHVDFMEAHQPDPWPDRGCAYNFNLGGTWYGAMQANTEYSGYVTLGYQPSDNSAVCGFHSAHPGDIYRFWLAIDEGGQGGYAFTEYPGLPQITSNEEPIWPRMAIDDQGNFHVVSHSHVIETTLYTRSTDGGNTWEDTTTLYFEPGGAGRNLDGGVFADRFNTPGKVIRYWSEWTGEGTGGIAQHAQDLVYQVSTDYGASWGSKTNLTQYQTSDTMRLYCQIKGIIDGNGDQHFFWPTCYFIGGTPYARSWVMHWSPSTGFNVVTGPHSMSNNPGGWRLPSDFAGPVLDKGNGDLYCVYVLNRDSDMSAGGFPNGELMAKASTDGGATWFSAAAGDTGVNLTNTPTPGGAPGQCADDDYPSIHPYVEMIGGEKSLVILYVEDKDAGGLPQGEGTETDNPVRCLVVPCNSIIGVEEEEPGIPKLTQLNVYPNPAAGMTRINYALTREAKVKISVLDAAGRVVENLVDRVEDAGYHTTYFRKDVPAGIYFVQMETEGYKATENLILVK